MVTIAEKDFNLIIAHIGAPTLDLVEDEFPLKEDDIKTLFIVPALEEYCRMFPITSDETKTFQGTLEIDFPDDQTYGLVDGRYTTINNVNAGGFQMSSNPFGNMLQMSTQTSSLYSGAKNSYGYNSEQFTRNFQMDSKINSLKASDVMIDQVNRKLICFTNVASVLYLKWAKYSENFNDVRYEYKKDVRELSASYLLQWWGNLLEMGNTDLPSSLDGDSLKSRGEDLEKKIVDKWEKVPKVAGMR